MQEIIHALILFVGQGINLRATQMQDTARSFSSLAKQVLRTADAAERCGLSRIALCAGVRDVARVVVTQIAAEAEPLRGLPLERALNAFGACRTGIRDREREEGRAARRSIDERAYRRRADGVGLGELRQQRQVRALPREVDERARPRLRPGRCPATPGGRGRS